MWNQAHLSAIITINFSGFLFVCLFSYRLIDSVTTTCTSKGYKKKKKRNKAITMESWLAFLTHCRSCFLRSNNPTILVIQTNFYLGYIERCFVPRYWKKKKVDSYCVSNILPNFWRKNNRFCTRYQSLTGLKPVTLYIHNRNVCTLFLILLSLYFPT